MSNGDEKISSNATRCWIKGNNSNWFKNIFYSLRGYSTPILFIIIRSKYQNCASTKKKLYENPKFWNEVFKQIICTKLYGGTTYFQSKQNMGDWKVIRWINRVNLQVKSGQMNRLFGNCAEEFQSLFLHNLCHLVICLAVGTSCLRKVSKKNYSKQKFNMIFFPFNFSLIFLSDESLQHLKFERLLQLIFSLLIERLLQCFFLIIPFKLAN